MKRLTSVIVTAALFLMALPALASTSVITTGEVNLRTGPGLDYASIGVVPKGTELVYLNESSIDDRGVAWYKISYGSSYSWVSSRYATLSNGEESVEKKEKTSRSGGTLWATAAVNIRSGPGVSYNTVGVLEEGASARYVGNDSYDAAETAWFQIETDEVSGWVSSAYVTFTEKKAPREEPEEEATVSGAFVSITGSRTNLRSGPGVVYSELTTMEEGDTAVYLDNYATDEYETIWYNVSYGDYTGWVSSRYAVLD
ncbi:MAG: hypothetical protein E7317_04315 [Clostridiales bacterium]|nr:hypothetical protein [Clostridiales bacterium]